MPAQRNTDAWYVVHAKTNAELLAADRLEELLQLEVYLPEVLQRYRGEMQLRPLFPGYLFVQADLRALHVSAINRTPGVIRLVACNGVPLPLRAQIVENIKKEVQRINSRGGWAPSLFSAGDQVRLSTGPLAGLHAVFLRYLPAKERAIVLLKFLGQQNEVEVDLAAIERIGQVRRRRRGRTTRGNRRYIYSPQQRPVHI